MAKAVKLPVGYGAAAPYARKGAPVYAKGLKRRRAARILRRGKKAKLPAGYGYGAAYAKKV